MKLLILIQSLDGGGAERVCANLANAWAARGVEVTLVTLASARHDFYSLHGAVKRKALDVAGVSGNLLADVRANWRRLLAVRRAIREGEPDVVLGTMTTANLLAVMAGIGLPCRVFVWQHTHPPMVPIGFFRERLRRWTYPRAAGVVALTEESRCWLERHCPGVRVSAIPNPLCWPLPRAEPVVPPQDWIEPDKRLLLAVGRLAMEKGFDLLLDAFSQISTRHPQWRLTILGEGPERRSLETMLVRLGLGSRVCLPGRVGNIGDWYERADLFVLSSRFEGLPMVVMEAMAYGTPAVSFDCETGPRDIIRHGVDGVLVPPSGGTNALAETLSRLMDDDALRKQFSERAIEVRERFSVAKILDLWEALFAGG